MVTVLLLFGLIGIVITLFKLFRSVIFYEQETYKLCLLCNAKKCNVDLMLLNRLNLGDDKHELLLRCSEGHLLKYAAVGKKHIEYCIKYIEGNERKKMMKEIDMLKKKLEKLGGMNDFSENINMDVVD